MHACMDACSDVGSASAASKAPPPSKAPVKADEERNEEVEGLILLCIKAATDECQGDIVTLLEKYEHAPEAAQVSSSFVAPTSISMYVSITITCGAWNLLYVSAVSSADTRLHLGVISVSITITCGAWNLLYVSAVSSAHTRLHLGVIHNVMNVNTNM
jgi:hypothetical protein